jgi:hypothetical protein
MEDLSGSMPFPHPIPDTKAGAECAQRLTGGFDGARSAGNSVGPRLERPPVAARTSSLCHAFGSFQWPSQSPRTETVLVQPGRPSPSRWCKSTTSS